MKPELRNRQDFWAGMMFIGIGGMAMFVARGYPFGTTLRMGPGYFPSVLGGILILFGIYVSARGLRRGAEKIKGRWSVRAMIMLPLSVVLFAVLIGRLGLIPALVALIFGSAAAGGEFKFSEVLLLTASLTLLSWVVFIWGLGLPYPLFVKNF